LSEHFISDALVNLAFYTGCLIGAVLGGYVGERFGMLLFCSVKLFQYIDTVYVDRSKIANIYL
jgi:predicted MFS family arabinose efflux permease